MDKLIKLIKMIITKLKKFYKNYLQAKNPSKVMVKYDKQNADRIVNILKNENDKNKEKALIRLNFMLDDNKRAKAKLNNYKPETEDEFIEIYHSIKGTKDELIKELDKNIKSLKLAIQRIGG